MQIIVIHQNVIQTAQLNKKTVAYDQNQDFVCPNTSKQDCLDWKLIVELRNLPVNSLNPNLASNLHVKMAVSIDLLEFKRLKPYLSSKKEKQRTVGL